MFASSNILQLRYLLLTFEANEIYCYLEECIFISIFSVKSVAPAALFLAAKVEEQPRKLEHVIKVAHACLHPQEPLPDTRSDVSS